MTKSETEIEARTLFEQSALALKRHRRPKAAPEAVEAQKMPEVLVVAPAPKSLPAPSVAPRNNLPAISEPLSPIAQVLATLGRLAADPAVDADKLDKLLAAQERLLDRQAKADFEAAMVRMKADLPIITKDGEIVIDKNRDQPGKKAKGTLYAKWETIRKIVDPILYRHGFALTHRLETSAENGIRVRAILIGHGHRDESCYIDLAPEGSGFKNPIQARGSSVAYGERYTGCALLGIATKGEDDDALKTGEPITIGDPISQEQVEQLVDFAEACEITTAALVNRMNKNRPTGHPEAKTLRDLPSFRFEEAMNALKVHDQAKRERGEKR